MGRLNYETAYLFEYSVTPSAFTVPPNNIALSSQTTDGSMGDPVGSLSTFDGDGGSHSYSLVSGPGSNDNNKFSINGTSLKVNSSVTEQASPYDVRIRSTDTDGHYTEKSFQISARFRSVPIPEPEFSRRCMQARGEPLKCSVAKQSNMVRFRRVPPFCTVSMFFKCDCGGEEGTVNVIKL